MTRTRTAYSLSFAICAILFLAVSKSDAEPPSGEASSLYGTWSTDYLQMAREQGIDVSTPENELMAIHFLKTALKKADAEMSLAFNLNLMKVNGMYVSAAFKSRPKRMVEVSERGKSKSPAMPIEIIDQNHIRMFPTPGEPGMPLKRDRDAGQLASAGPLAGKWNLDEKATLAGMTADEQESFSRQLAKRPAIRFLEFEPMSMNYDGRYFVVPQWPMTNGPMRVVGIYSGKKRISIDFVYLSADVIGLRSPDEPTSAPVRYNRK